MKLRAWLVLSFVGFALMVVVLFGAIAYQIAIDSETGKKTDLLQNLVKEQATMLVARSGAIRWSEWLYPEDPEKNIHLVLSKTGAGELRPTMSSSAVISIDGDAYRSITNQISSGKTGGQTELDGESFIWAAAAIESSPYTLLTLHRIHHNFASHFKTLGVRLIAAGTVIVWIAVWGGLVVAGLFVKRQEKHSAAILHQALHDELTGLPNRNLLYDRLEQAIFLARRAQKNVALLIMDLDRFKEVNDALGHQSGDQLLKQTSERLREASREFDTVARLGGDEFAILLPNGNVQQATLLANKVIQILDPVYNINGTDIDAKASIGIAVYPDHGENAEDLIRHADVAMYQAKQQGIGIAVYAAESDPQSLRRLTLHGDLRHAIEGDVGLTLHYQPQVDLISGSVIGVEALLRWHHPQKGFIPPDEFIPLAERSGLITPITELVLNKAFHQYNIWRRAGIHLNVSINLSAKNLHDARLPANTGRLLGAWNIPPNDVHLEITESAMMADPFKAKKILLEFNAMGINLAVDDFGTGYSSLAYLKQLPVDSIKIDKSFVLNMTTDRNDASIVRATIDLAHHLDLKVVAEGVENKETLSALLDLGCDIAQGYYISKPVPADELVRWLAHHNAAPDALAPVAT